MVKRAGTDTWIKALVEMTLQPGDTIKTGDYSGTEITFFEGSTVELEASTEITVAELGISAGGSTKVRLTQLLGKTVTRVKKLTDPGSSFDIETPAAIAAVRGSTMTVTVAANGRTVVGNEHGDIRIIVAGTEYTISEGMQRTIAPGEPPSAEMPIVPPGGFPPPPQARLDVTLQAAPPEAHVGDVITYTCSLHNSGDLSFNSISASSNVSGNATYQSGDTNNNGLLDPNETWLLTSTYSVHAADYPQVVASANISATTSSGVTLVDTETVTTSVLPVVITTPLNNATVHNRMVVVAGSVFDEAFTEGTIAVNGGEPVPLTISETGSFNTSANLTDGTNAITVTVSEGLHSASHTITVNLDPYGMRIELTWDTGALTDMDLHLIRPGGTYGDNVSDSDCYYGNRNPDWGIPDVTFDDPLLIRDDFDGYGPETITLLQPYEEGTYHVKVLYYNDDGIGAATATVRIYIREVLAGEFTMSMNKGDIWYCAMIDWPSGVVNVPPT